MDFKGPKFEGEEQKPEGEISAEQVLSNLSAKENELRKDLNKSRGLGELGLVTEGIKALIELQSNLELDEEMERNPKKLLGLLEGDLRDEKERFARVREGVARGEYAKESVEEWLRSYQSGIIRLERKIALLKEAAGL